MTRWLIATVIETDDDYTPTDIRAQIERDLNRGDGMYFTTAKSVCTIRKQDRVKDDE